MDGQSKDCISHLLIQDSTTSAFHVNWRYFDESFSLALRRSEASSSSETFAWEEGREGREGGVGGGLALLCSNM